MRCDSAASTADLGSLGDRAGRAVPTWTFSERGR
jgi:hypothetical protein